jgi:hypothetical protein
MSLPALGPHQEQVLPRAPTHGERCDGRGGAYRRHQDLPWCERREQREFIAIEWQCGLSLEA